MEGAIFLIALAIIAVLIIPLILSISINSNVKRLMGELDKTKAELKRLVSIIETHNISPTANEKQAVKAEAIIIVEKPTVQEHKAPIVVPEPIIPRETITPIAPNAETPKPEEIKPIVPRETTETKKVVIQQAPIKRIPSVSKPFFGGNLEKFIGEKLISIVGIAILVLGIVFTVKWAIDREMISDAAKILLGLVSGTLLIGLAHKLSKNYRAFSSILAGGGIAILYFSVFEAYQAYHLLPQTAAFICMILVTVFAVILSIIYDKKELAIIAIVGGFATPFLVSSGDGNYKVLFSYLLILNIGMFFLASFKKWSIVNIISYALTVIIFGSWMYKENDGGQVHAHNGFVFATLFFLTFFGMNLIYNIKNKTKFQPIDLGLLLSNSFSYFGVGLYFLHLISDGKYQGAFTAALAIFNFAFAYIFYKKQNIDSNVKYFLIGLVLTFISLIAPIQLDGNYITLFWACEMVLLLYLGQKTNNSLIKNTSILMLALAIISLMLDWQNNYFCVHISKLPIIVNKAFITGMIVLTAILLKAKLLKKEINSEYLLWGILLIEHYKKALIIIFILLLYAAGFFEINYQLNTIHKVAPFTTEMLWAYHYIFASLLIVFVLKFKEHLVVKMSLAIGAISLIFYPIASSAIGKMRNISLQNEHFNHFTIWHALIPMFALFILFILIQYIRQNLAMNSTLRIASSWILSFLFLFIISDELVSLWTIMNYEPGFSLHDGFKKASKIAWPIAWSLTSLGLMIWGMKEKIKHLRIISLTLFAVTILKLFFYDISNVSQGGKIAAFIILGIILLLVSFLYQKIKGIFIDEKSDQNNIQN